MVVPIGNIVNKSIFSPTNFSTTITALNVKSSIPTMSSATDIGMVIPTGQVPTSKLEVRGRNPTSSVNLSRESLMASSEHSTPYHDRMDTDMDFNPTIEEPSLELSYKTEQEKALWVSMAANHQETIRPLNVHNEAPPNSCSPRGRGYQHSTSLWPAGPYQTRAMEWIFLPHFSPWIHWALCIRLQEHQSLPQLLGQIHQEQTG